MKRKQLLELPIPSLVTGVYVEETEIKEIRYAWDKNKKYQETYYNYIYTVLIDKSTDEEVLIIDLYKASGLHIWRYFLNKKGQYFRLISKDKKISNAGMDYILDNSYYPRKNYFCDKKANQTACEFLGCKEINNVLKYIAEINCNYKIKNHEKKLDKIRKSIDNAMLEIRNIPKPVYEWVDNTLLKFSRYIFYEYSSKKQVSGYCTHCKQDVIINRPKNESKGKCPNCKSLVTFKAKKKFLNTNGFTDKKEFTYLQSTKKGFCARTFTVSRTYKKYYRQVDTYYDETWRSFYEYERLKGYKQKSNFEYGQFRNTYEYRFYEYYGLVNRPVKLYPSNLNKLLKKSRETKHIDFNNIARYCNELKLDNLMDYAKHCPAVETLYKNKFYKCLTQLINEYVGYELKKEFDFDKTNVRKILGVSKLDIPILQKLNLSFFEISIYKLILKKEKAVNINLFKRFMDLDLDYESYMKILDLTTVHSFMRYYNEQKEDFEKIYKMQYSYYSYENIAKRFVTEWLDYCNNANKLKFNLKNRNILFPKNLKAAHDRTANDVKEFEKMEKEKFLMKMADYKQEYDNKFYFENKVLFITAPKDYNDLVNEGERLHHCVATYGTSIVEKNTIILFIRKLEEPESPYFTLELNPKTYEIRQCRGLQNCSYGNDVENFISQWKKVKLTNIKISA